ncbi:hypothetical protein GGR57DRAFT_501403 [Xylariaceae sp. FL1272]|nr:hypothetical protein GGR57DRAFT_501403 [Xylariaceae sp. FL1272]
MTPLSGVKAPDNIPANENDQGQYTNPSTPHSGATAMASNSEEAVLDDPTDCEPTASEVLQATTQDDDNGAGESYHRAKRLAFLSQMSDIQSRELLNKEKTGGVLSKRSKQAIIHTTFTELRIETLERELENMRIDVYNLPKKLEVKEPKKEYPVHQRVLRRSEPAAFKINRISLKVPVKDRPVLETQTIKDAHVSDKHPGSGHFHQRQTEMEDLPNNFHVADRLRIRSRPLLRHIFNLTGTTIISSYDLTLPEEDSEEQSSVVILRPFKLLVTFEEKLRDSLLAMEKECVLEAEGHIANKKQQDYSTQDLLLDLKLLIQFMDEDMQPIWELRRNIEAGTATHICYEDLWHLFKRGDIVAHSSSPHAYRVMNFTGGRPPLIDRLQADENKPVDGFVIDCLSIQYDGTNYIPQLQSFSIRPFLGTQRITSLPIYPLKLSNQSKKLHRQYAMQGKAFLELTTPPFLHKHLRGRTLDEPPHDIDAQVIVDMSMALNVTPQWRPSTDKITQDSFTAGDQRETQMSPWCWHSKFYEACCGSDVAFKDLELDKRALTEFMQENQRMLGPRKAEELSEEDLMLLPHKVHGFILRNRQWVTLQMNDLSNVRFQNELEKLMLPPRHKSAIQALVKVHENARSSVRGNASTIGTSIDLVKGKGAGLIILLHGEPGVGKTSTAECVADDTSRPLFPITCGDIGETAVQVEKNLHYNFRLAHKWGCVLLLDEADVFLAKRSKTDLRRNAVTSVFLRSLEYYSGILFLTTNRVGSIDPAFKSRIHISLFYPKFTLETTLNLYQVYIERTRDEQEKAGSSNFSIKDKEILKFAKRHFREMEKEGLDIWNGRQIRNAFQAAIALVEYDSQNTKAGDPKPVLGAAQFRIVADSSKEFDRYLLATLGAGDSDIARREEWRFDHFAGRDSAQPHPMQRHINRTDTHRETRSRVDREDTSSDESETSDDSSSDDTSRKKQSAKKGKGADQSRGEEVEFKDLDEFREYMKYKKLSRK